MKRVIGVCMIFILMVSLTACHNAAPQTSDGNGQTLLPYAPVADFTGNHWPRSMAKASNQTIP